MINDLTGRTFGELTVLKEDGRNSSGNVAWLCKCSCGRKKRVGGSHLLRDTKSCGHLIYKEPYRWLYNYMKWIAKRKKVPVDLTYEEFITFTKIDKCHYCGDKIVWNPHSNNRKTLFRYNLDRISNEDGYSVKNCVVACPTCNRLKGKKTIEQFIEMCNKCKKILEHRN